MPSDKEKKIAWLMTTINRLTEAAHVLANAQKVLEAHANDAKVEKLNDLVLDATKSIKLFGSVKAVNTALFKSLMQDINTECSKLGKQGIGRSHLN